MTHAINLYIELKNGNTITVKDLEYTSDKDFPTDEFMHILKNFEFWVLETVDSDYLIRTSEVVSVTIN